MSSTNTKPHTGCWPLPASAHMHYWWFHGWSFSTCFAAPLAFAILPTTMENTFSELAGCCKSHQKHFFYFYFVTSWWLRSINKYCNRRARFISVSFHHKRKLMVSNFYSGLKRVLNPNTTTSARQAGGFCRLVQQLSCVLFSLCFLQSKRINASS